MMAAPVRLTGPLAAFVIVPLLAGLTVWATWRIGALVLGPITGLVAAAWLASSPIVLYQSMQPMSDVPAMAWWTLATLGLMVHTPATIAGAGLAAGAALLTNPNLLPLAALLGLTLFARRAGSPLTARLRSTLLFAIGALPFVGAVLWWQRLQFGSPWNTGYGPLTGLFDPANAPANTRLRLGDANAIAALDWPPVADVGEPARTRIYAAADRPRYFAGASWPVDRLR